MQIIRTYGLNFHFSFKDKQQMVLSSIEECYNSYIINAIKIVRRILSCLVENHIKTINKRCSRQSHSRSIYATVVNFKDSTQNYNINTNNKSKSYHKQNYHKS